MFSIFNTLNEKKWFTKPTSDLVQLRVCKQSGFRASEICDDTEVKDVPSGAQHSKVCPFHKTIHLDASGRYRVNSSCYSVENMQHKAWFLPSPVQEYFYKQRSLSFKALPPYLPGCLNELNHRQMELLYPRDGFEIYVPVDETDNKSRCVFKALHKRSGAILFWHLDGEFVGNTEKYHQLSLSPSPGEHFLEITDDAGESLVCKFKVLKKQQF
jgi:penicillin-binding protein 1C